MDIQNGKLYQNRTWKYLYSSLRAYESKLMIDLSSFFRLAIGIQDKNSKIEGENLFILISTNTYLVSDRDLEIYRSRFGTFLDWLQYQPYYTADYPYEKDKSHMVVIKIPDIHALAYEAFIRGIYSKMYTLKEVESYFQYCNLMDKEAETKRNEVIKNCRDILTKDKKYIPIFVDIVKKKYVCDAYVEDFQEAELDFPPELSEEIFNYEIE